MVRFSIAISVVFAVLLVSGDAVSGAIDSIRGKKHAVLLFSKSRSDAGLDKQVGLLSERRPELDQRRMVVIMTAGNRESMAVVGYASISAGTARKLRQDFEPADSGMTVILVDHDGNEVERWRGVVDPQLLFDAIDAVEKAKESAVEG